MTHTSQRRGLCPSCPGEELAILAMIPREYTKKRGIKGAMAALGRKILNHDPSSWIFEDVTEIIIPQLGIWQHLAEFLYKVWPGFAKHLLMWFTCQNSAVITAVYTDVEAVKSLLKGLKRSWVVKNKKKGYPISICLSGLAEDIRSCCEEAGLREHTYLYSLGAFGAVQNLPSEDELALITMCGHGLIASSRIKHLVKLIRDGELTARQAAEDIAKPCVCGVVNTERAEGVFSRLATDHHNKMND